MAKKLRWHTVHQILAGGVALENNGARFTNESGQDMLIRQIHGMLEQTGGDPNENSTAQLSTQNTFLEVDDEDEFRIMLKVGEGSTGATPTAGNSVTKDHWYFDRGQMPLEQGETLFSSTSGTAAPGKLTTWLIGYELDE